MSSPTTSATITQRDSAGRPAPSANGLVRVGPRAGLSGVTVVSGGRHGIAVFASSTTDQVYAVDNRCPHLGFPLHQGSVQDGILTCHWHHARFDLASGGTFDPWADDVQTYSVSVADGIVYVDPRPQPTDRAARARERLRDGLEQQLNLIIVKQVLALMAEREPPASILAIGGRFGATYREGGWLSGLTILTAMGNLLPELNGSDRTLALYHGLVQVARDCAGQPPRFALTPLPIVPGGHPEVQLDQLGAWFRRFIEVRDADGAERALLTAIATGAEPATLAGMLGAAATDHFFLDVGHTLDFVNKACELLDQIGWHEADVILPSLIPGLAQARRSEEMNAWRHPVDLVALLEPVFDRLPAYLDGAGANEAWRADEGLIAVLLGDDPAAIVAALEAALAAGAPVTAVSQAVSYAAALRIARFHTANEFADWITVLHTFTNANAVHQLLKRAPSAELLRGVFHAAMRLYLDRFLNLPAARLPDERPAHRATLPSDPDRLLGQLRELLDREQQISAAARVVDHWLALGHAPAPLIAELGHLLLREDAEFHTYQMLEAGVALHRELVTDDPLRANRVLVAATRYLAAHAPTSRALLQTAATARRLQRGDDLAADPADEEAG